jgi:hypothetical protein
MLCKKCSCSLNIPIKKSHSEYVYQHHFRSRKFGIWPIFMPFRKDVVVQKAVNYYNLYFHGFGPYFLFVQKQFKDSRPFLLRAKIYFNLVTYNLH